MSAELASHLVRRRASTGPAHPREAASQAAAVEGPHDGGDTGRNRPALVIAGPLSTSESAIDLLELVDDFVLLPDYLRRLAEVRADTFLPER